MIIPSNITFTDVQPAAMSVLKLAGEKACRLNATWNAARGTPVFTVEGKYTTRGWTEWTQGFQYGIPILAFDATGDADLLDIGRRNTVSRMMPHVTHIGVHDHGFNNLSTYGNLRRLMREGRIPLNDWELAFYETAIKVSGAVQASRWTNTADGGGFIYSFNGPHSLFVDTIRTIRILGAAHQLGHVLMGENDRKISLLDRLLAHAKATAKFIVFMGDSGHTYDVRGRTSHEAIFNTNDGNFRCRSTQQGYSPFSTWTRGLAWAILGFAEELEFLKSLGGVDVAAMQTFDAAARATADHYLNDCTASDGIPYWDDGAPGLAKLADWGDRPADPFNHCEPVDSSAAAIAAQGLLRLGLYLGDEGASYTRGGLAVATTLFSDAYVARDANHEGLILHSVYHRPNGWDYIPPRRKIPCGESSMWGDYHAVELALLIDRVATNKPYYTFFDAAKED